MFARLLSHCGSAVAIHAEIEVDSDDVKVDHLYFDQSRAYELPGKILFVNVRNPFSKAGEIVS